MRRYELMLVFRPDAPDDRITAIIDRTTRQVINDGGQIVKVAPWGRRRLAYAMDRHREGAYHIVVFEAPTTAIAELERGLLITEEVLRHLVVRQGRPSRASRDSGLCFMAFTSLQRRDTRTRSTAWCPGRGSG